MSLAETLSPAAAALLAHLRAHQTASRALDIWCRARFPAEAQALRVTVLQDRPLSPREAARLRCLDAGALRYRRVEIRWGARLLSRAVNLYFPDRLPGAVAGRLLNSDMPFGLMLEGHGPQRRVLAAGARAGACVLRLDVEMTLPPAGSIAFLREDYRASLLGGHL